MESKQLAMPDRGIIDDPELMAMIQHEKVRQRNGVALIASENYTSKGVMEILGTPLQNKYAEGYPGKRYYPGNEYIDQIENLAKKRALEAFHLDPEVWDVNVQPLSGAPANIEVYTGLIGKDGKIMGLHLPDGGHLTHGFKAGEKCISATSMYFQSKAYHCCQETGLIDYDTMEKDALEFKPQILIAGYSAYTKDLDYKRFREVADKVGAYLHVDMAHYCGLVSAQVLSSPFDYADVVTTTTHKIMRGPRGGMIFYKKELKEKIDFAVFPQLQGGPHMNQIAALAFALKELVSEDYVNYAKQVQANAKALAEAMISKGWSLQTGGTENHMVMWNVKPLHLTGNKVEKILERVSIYANKNSIIGDKSPMNPGGVRIGTPAMTTRGFKEEEFKQLADFFGKAVDLATRIQDKVGKKIHDFEVALKEGEFVEELNALQLEVNTWCDQYPVPAGLA